ncbi:MAG: four-carbon acid sugar kinase family protein [Nitrolancea sp.]
MTRIAIIADDLTGAADAAVAFANRGHSSRVLLDPGFTTGVDVIAVTTESRHLPPSIAADRVRAMAHHLYGTPLLYKKIDSTLRGNLTAELFALMEAFEVQRALVAPAFPAQGRTTVRGRQFINGEPLEQSDFRAQVPTSNLREIFLRAHDARPVGLILLSDVRRGASRVNELLTARSTGIMIADAETDTDLATIARAVLSSGLRLICGSAGLCHPLAQQIQTGHDTAANPPIQAGGPIITIAGSLHTATIKQIERARAAGIAVIEPVNFATRAIDVIVEQAATQVENGQDVVIASHLVDDSTPSDLAVSDRLARLADRLLRRVQAGGLVLTGGDVASATCRELGIRAIDLFGEVQPGIPYGVLRGGGADMMPVVTKAGGFGDADAIVTSIRFLKGE